MKIVILVSFILIVIIGCARTWMYQPIEKFRPAVTVPPASVCHSCHPDQFGSWKKNRHGDENRMSRVPVAELRECEACHQNTSAHVADPQAKVPAKIAKMTKSDQNSICGKCHHNQELFKGRGRRSSGQRRETISWAVDLFSTGSSG